MFFLVLLTFMNNKGTQSSMLNYNTNQNFSHTPFYISSINLNFAKLCAVIKLHYNDKKIQPDSSQTQWGILDGK